MFKLQIGKSEKKENIYEKESFFTYVYQEPVKKYSSILRKVSIEQGTSKKICYAKNLN